MEFKIDRDTFSRALRLAQHVADRKSTMPILANVLLRVTEGTLLVQATDLQVSTVTEIEINGKSSERAVSVAAKQLADVVASLPPGSVGLKRIDGEAVEINSGKVKYRLPGVAARDFPRLPSLDGAKGVDVSASALRSMIDRTLFSVCHDESRHHLNGIYLEMDGTTATMVATDGHRMAKVCAELPGIKMSGGVIIPKKGAAELMRMLDGADTCALAFGSSHAFATVDGSTLAVKLIDAVFPPYGQVIPKHRRSATVKRSDLADAFRRSQIIASTARGVVARFGDESVTISSQSPDTGDVTEEIGAAIDGADGVKVGINPRYMLDALGHFDGETVDVRVGSESDPVHIVDGRGLEIVIMPMRMDP